MTAQQLRRCLVLRVQAPLATFSRVGGPTRGGNTLPLCCSPSLCPCHALVSWRPLPDQQVFLDRTLYSCSLTSIPFPAPASLPTLPLSPLPGFVPHSVESYSATATAGT